MGWAEFRQQHGATPWLRQPDHVIVTQHLDQDAAVAADSRMLLARSGTSAALGPRAAGLTSCPWPSRARSSARGIACCNVRAVSAMNGKLAVPYITSAGTDSRAARPAGTVPSSPRMAVWS